MRDAEAEYQERRLHAAREAFRFARQGRVPPNGSAESWPKWWEERYGDGQTFDEFVRQKRAERVAT